MRELVEEVAIQARKCEYVDQNSGVSARMPISLLENVVSNAERRGLRTGETTVWPRLGDLHGAIAAISGKVELVYEGEQEGPTNVARAPRRARREVAVRARFPDAFKTRGRGKDAAAAQVYAPIVEWFAGGKDVEISDESSAQELYDELSQVTGLEELATKHLPVTRMEEVGPAMEFVLEGLHQNSILSRKRVDGGGTAYNDMLKSMFSGFQSGDED